MLKMSEITANILMVIFQNSQQQKTKTSVKIERMKSHGLLENLENERLD